MDANIQDHEQAQQSDSLLEGSLGTRYHIEYLRKYTELTEEEIQDEIKLMIRNSREKRKAIHNLYKNGSMTEDTKRDYSTPYDSDEERMSQMRTLPKRYFPYEIDAPLIPLETLYADMKDTLPVSSSPWKFGMVKKRAFVKKFGWASLTKRVVDRIASFITDSYLHHGEISGGEIHPQRFKDTFSTVEDEERDLGSVTTRLNSHVIKESDNNDVNNKTAQDNATTNTIKSVVTSNSQPVYRVLELGSGRGLLAHLLTTSYPEIQVVATDSWKELSTVTTREFYRIPEKISAEDALEKYATDPLDPEFCPILLVSWGRSAIDDLQKRFSGSKYIYIGDAFKRGCTGGYPSKKIWKPVIEDQIAETLCIPDCIDEKLLCCIRQQCL